MDTPNSKLYYKEETDMTYLVSNDRVDRHGKIADKRTTGGWKAAPFIIVNEVIERLAFFAIAVNIGTYLVTEMHQTIPDAVTHVTDWVGAAYVLTLLGAFLADAYLGRFRTIVIFSGVYAVGMVLLTVSASFDTLRPKTGKEASNYQLAFLYGALGLIALGTGGIKPCVSSFGADQFDEGDEKEVQMKYSFFNWFYFAINMGAILGITLLVYIQVQLGWSWGFGIPTVTTILSIVVLAAGVRYYRFQKPMGSPFTRFLQVIVVSVKKHRRGVLVENETSLYEVETTYSDIIGARKLPHTHQYRFFDKAAVIAEKDTISNRWCVCTVTQVEEFKSFVKVLPIWASTIALAISFSQMSTFFLSQAQFMNRKLGNNFEIPIGSVPVFGAINGLILVPFYEKFIIPFLRKFTGHHRGITSLQRMGVGLFISIFAMASAALVEKTRREHYPIKNSMSVFWLLPQFFLIGAAEVFTYVGQLEFFYDEATDGTKSISSALFLSEIGIGSWLSTALVKIIIATTGGQEKGWLRNNLNLSKLDLFFWILAGINAINFLVYLMVAKYHKGKGSAVRDENMVELEFSNDQQTQA
ncbi:protein NRT1/ PTR FAMILY 8.1 [Trifolium repens]|nr:protein NRT1/ PTR FAMILY 8.1 [Trifolium repens]